MQTRFPRASLARDEGEVVPSSQTRFALELAKAISQVMICELERGVEVKLKLVRGNMNKLPTNTTKAFNHIIVCLASIWITVLSVIVLNKVFRLRANVKVIIERRNFISNEMDHRLSRVAGRLVIMR